MTITEPATLITDYLLAAFTAVLASRLRHAARHNRDARQGWWAVAFGATAAAGLTGGSVHGFRTVLPSPVTVGLWIVTLESLVLAGYAVIRGSLAASRDGSGSGRAAMIAAVYIAYGVWVALNPRFVFVILAYGVALVVLVISKLRVWRIERRTATWMVAGVLVSVVAAIIQQSGFSLHEHFNHNDLYHVVQALGVWFFYRGAITRSPAAARG